jgi:hypothetical protein
VSKSAGRERDWRHALLGTAEAGSVFGLYVKRDDFPALDPDTDTGRAAANRAIFRENLLFSARRIGEDFVDFAAIRTLIAGGYEVGNVHEINIR